MKLSPESPELTAYALGALNADERAEVEAALAASPELRAEVAALTGTAGELARAFAAEPALTLTPAQRATLEDRASLVVGGDTVPSSDRSPASRSLEAGRRTGPVWWDRVLAWRQQLIWGAVGACALALTFFLLPRQRPPADGFGELRYQRQMPEIAPDLPAVEPRSLDVATPLSKANRALAEQNLGELESLRARSIPPQPAPAPIVLTESLDRAAASPGTGGVPAAGRAIKTRTLEERSDVYAMDPKLARRYGLAPANKPASPSRTATTELGAPADRASASAVQPAVGGLSASAGQPREFLKEQVAVQEKSDFLESRKASLPPVVRFQDKQEVELRLRLPEPPGTESYGEITDNPFKDTFTAPLSTFGLDVDTASYANARRFLRDGSLPPRDAVRLEELINYFRYEYPQPRGGEPFGTAIEVIDSPWTEGHRLVRIGLQAKSVDRAERPRANLVFLLDVSGSMAPENKLPLVKSSLRLMLDRLGDRDTVGIVTYAGESRIALEPTAVTVEGRRRITDVIQRLRAGSGTAGAAGIVSAYAMATNRFEREGVNRVILCTDGDFNIGVSDPAELQRLIEDQAKSGVFLSVLGFGMGNLKDSTMELLADKGNGNYGYVDSFSEARKLLGEQLDGTLVTVAKDVKVQVEFNPARVKAYRLLGYENRALRDRDFNDDTKDAGEVGAGHQVTVLYEIIPAGPDLAGTDPLRYQGRPEPADAPSRIKPGHGDELLLLKLRYKQPDGDTSRLIETAVKDERRESAQASADTRFAAAVAGYGMLLRQSPHKGDLTWEKVLRLAEQGLGTDREGYRAEFVDLVRRARQLAGGR